MSLNYKFERPLINLSRIESEFPFSGSFYPLQKLNVPPHQAVLFGS